MRVRAAQAKPLLSGPGRVFGTHTSGSAISAGLIPCDACTPSRVRTAAAKSKAERTAQCRCDTSRRRQALGHHDRREIRPSVRARRSDADPVAFSVRSHSVTRGGLTLPVFERRSAPVVCRRLQRSQPFADPPPRGSTSVTQLRIPPSFRAPDVRRVRLRLKLSQLVIDRLGVGGEAKKFRVTLVVVHMDNLTARDSRGKGVRSTRPAGRTFVALRSTQALGSVLLMPRWVMCQRRGTLCSRPVRR
jgi:hypothetical protein